MYKVQKTIEICGSHHLELNYDSPCSRLHGHNWQITVYMQARSLDENGMVFDFAEIKKLIHGKFDHKHLNDVVDFNPTAENLAHYIWARLNANLAMVDIERHLHCYKVEVEETHNNIASYKEE